MPNTHTTLGGLFSDIANAIRAKTGSAASIKADDFPTEIGKISGGGVSIEQLSVTANGIYTAPTGKAYNPVVVNISGARTVYNAIVDVVEESGVMSVTCGFKPQYIAVAPVINDFEAVAPSECLINGTSYESGAECVVVKSEDSYGDSETHIEAFSNYFAISNNGFTFGNGDLPFASDQYYVIATN